MLSPAARLGSRFLCMRRAFSASSAMEALVLRSGFLFASFHVDSDFEETVEHIAQLESKKVTMESLLNLSPFKRSQTIGIRRAAETPELGVPGPPFLSSGATHPLSLFCCFPIMNRRFDRWKKGGRLVQAHSAPFLCLLNRFEFDELYYFVLLTVGTSLLSDSLSLLFSALSDNDIKLRYLELDCAVFASPLPPSESHSRRRSLSSRFLPLSAAVSLRALLGWCFSPASLTLSRLHQVFFPPLASHPIGDEYAFPDDLTPSPRQSYSTRVIDRE